MRKSTFLRGALDSSLIIWRCGLGIYASLAKGLKLKVRKFWGLIPTFIEATEKNW